MEYHIKSKEMKRLWIILFVAFCWTYEAMASEPVYLICDALADDQDSDYGIFRTDLAAGKEENSGPVFISLENKSLQMEIVFCYYDYNFSELAKLRLVKSSDFFEKRVEPVAFLNTISPIDLNAKLPTLTKASAEAWIDELRDKKVYMIDRSEIGPDSVIIRQVEPYYAVGF